MVGHRVTGERCREPCLLEIGSLEWQDRQKPIEHPSDSPSSPWSPCPDLRRDVTHGSNSHRLRGGCKAKVEAWIVHKDRETGTALLEQVACLPIRLEEPRGGRKHRKDPHDGVRSEVFGQLQARLGHLGAAVSKCGESGEPLLELPNECRGVQIPGGFTCENRNQGAGHGPNLSTPRRRLVRGGRSRTILVLSTSRPCGCGDGENC